MENIEISIRALFVQTNLPIRYTLFTINKLQLAHLESLIGRYSNEMEIAAVSAWFWWNNSSGEKCISIGILCLRSMRLNKMGSTHESSSNQQLIPNLIVC